MSPIKCAQCTHIKVTGHRCGSPALRGEHFCYFHHRMIKGGRFRVDMKVNASALLEDTESIQVAIMDVTTQLIENSIDWRRASLIIRALQIAARNARTVNFGSNASRMVREVPNWELQWMKEHGEKPISKKELEQALAPSPQLPANAAVAAKPAPLSNPPATAPLTTADAPPATDQGPKTSNSPSPAPANDPRPKTNDSPFPGRQLRELQRVHASLNGARKGGLSDLKAVLKLAGLAPPIKSGT